MNPDDYIAIGILIGVLLAGGLISTIYLFITVADLKDDVKRLKEKK